MRCYLLIFVGILCILSCCTIADQVTDNRFISPNHGAGMAAGISTALKTVPLPSSPATTVPSAIYSPDLASSRFKPQKPADAEDGGVTLTADSTTVVNNYIGDGTPRVSRGTTGTSKGGQSPGVTVLQSYASTRNTTVAILDINTNSTASATKSPASGKNTSGTAGKLQQSGSKLLLNEAEREFSRMTSSYYTHTTYVDEKTGTYNYDCSGFVGYALSRAVPGAFNALQHKRPVAADFYDHIVQCGPAPGNGGWMRVVTPLDLLPGDIVVWLKPDASDSTSTGHVMIVTGIPVKNPQRAGEVLVQVIDSTESGHTNDTRGSGQTGLGKGTIGIMTDTSGLPTGYYWRGGESRLLQKTEIAFGRIA